MNAKPSVLVVTGIAVVAVAYLAVSSTRAASERNAAPAGPTPRGEVVAPGRVEAASDVIDLGFEQSGRVIAVEVGEGERVKKGQVLARLDDRVAVARLARAEAARDVTRARRDAAFRGSRVAEIRAAEADVDVARARARNDAGERQRGDRLAGSLAIPSAEVDRLRHGAEAAAASLMAAEARLALVREGTRGEMKRAALAEVAAAEAEAEEARVLLAQTQLRAPIDGVVLRVHSRVGEQVSMMPPTVVMSLADLDRLQVRAEVDEEDIGRVSVDQTGYVRADAYGDRRFPGRVIRVMRDVGRKVMPNDDPRARVDTRVLEVIFTFDTPPSLPLGLRMNLHLPAPPGRRS
ncbi:MAG TPA: HlyD family efflux transporter periplasmic adaptor subunit [Polyangia bacterium]